MDSVPAQLANPTRMRQLEVRRILDTPREEAFDRITRLVAGALKTSVALLTFVDRDRQWFKSSHGLPDPWFSRRQTPLSHSFCQYVVAFKKPLVVPDAKADPLVRDNL